MLNLSFLALIFAVPQLSGPELLPPCASSTPLPAQKSTQPLNNYRLPPNVFDRLAGFDIPVYTGAVTAFSATTDSRERIWVALATPEGEVSLYLSYDEGKSWCQSFSVLLTSEISQLEMVTGQGDPCPVFVFYLTTDNSGDLWLLRVAEDLVSWDTLPVAVGPDTIDDFSVTVDKDPNYYLYCLFVNEHHPGTGRNGRFIRSFNRGLSWEMPQDFWNCYDPHISFGTGSVLHCIWRYALSGREVHYAFNRYYGAPARWSGLSVLSRRNEKCFNPVVTQAATFPPWRATVWAIWCAARRDSEMLDLVVRFSTDGGVSWNEPQNLGEMFLDEWWPSLSADTYRVNLAYTCGGKKANDPTVVYSRYSPSYAPGVWTSPVKLNDPRANATFESTRPRAVATGAIFSYYGTSYPQGVYFDTYLPFLAPYALRPTPYLVRSSKTKNQELRTNLFDPAGRRVNTENPSPGVYFFHAPEGIKKIVILK